MTTTSQNQDLEAGNALPTTAAALVVARLGDDHIGIRFEDDDYTWDDFARAAVRRSHFLAQHLDPAQPPHLGILLENRPEFLFWWGGCALSGAALVCMNPTRRGQELVDDVLATDCQILIVDSMTRGLIDSAALPGVEVIDIDAEQHTQTMDGLDDTRPPQSPAAADPKTILTMQFTSGSTGRPKAAMCSTGRFTAAATYGSGGLGPQDVSYNSMPLFHSNSILGCWATPLYQGGTFVLARRFSASRFLDDLLKYEVTYFNYVGRVLSYILAQPEREEEKLVKLKSAFGTEAPVRDRKEFARRFGIEPFESYGSSEGGLNFVRSADTPEDALGLPPAGTAYTAAVIDPIDMSERPRARFGEHGELLNADEAIGELAALGTRGTFEGYYKDPEAESERLRGNNFLSGDLGYRDEAGYFYFAGRSGDRLRVDGENFSGAPIERIIGRYPDAQLAAIYPVPDEISGDQVMLALQMVDGRTFDPVGFGEFLDAQADLGTKWAPRYIRIVDTLPVTATAKINKKELRKDAWHTDDPVYYRPGKGNEYHRLEPAHVEELLRRFEDSGRKELLNR